MTQRDDVRADGDIVHGADVQVVGGVASDDAGDQGPGAEEASGQRGQLVGGLGIGLVLGGDELVGRVVRVVGGRLGREAGVADEAAVVDAAGEVEGRVGLHAVANGDGRELEVC